MKFQINHMYEICTLIGGGIQLRMCVCCRCADAQSVNVFDRAPGAVNGHYGTERQHLVGNGVIVASALGVRFWPADSFLGLYRTIVFACLLCILVCLSLSLSSSSALFIFN